MTVAHRHGLSNLKPQTAIIEGWDRWGGAFATSYSHDSHNLIIYGHDPQEMVLAGNTVIGMGGGNAVVKDGKVIAKIAYPVAGMLSLDDPAEVCATARGDGRGGGTNLCLAAALPHVQGAQRAIPGLQSGAASYGSRPYRR